MDAVADGAWEVGSPLWIRTAGGFVRWHCENKEGRLPYRTAAESRTVDVTGWLPAMLPGGFARLLLDVGDEVLVEDPGYPGIRASLLGHGALVRPVPLDERSHFFELGGKSIQAMQLSGMLGEALGREVPVSLLFQSPTLAAYCAALAQPAAYEPPVRQQPLAPVLTLHDPGQAGGRVVGEPDGHDVRGPVGSQRAQRRQVVLGQEVQRALRQIGRCSAHRNILAPGCVTPDPGGVRSRRWP